MFTDMSKSLKAEEIKEVEKSLGIVFPKQLVTHYLKYNGGMPIKNYLYSPISDIETMVQTFLPIKYKDEVGYTLEGMYLRFIENNTFPKNYLPFAIDAGGNLFCINLNNGNIVMIWLDLGDVDEKRIPVLCNSFDEFIGSLEEYEDY